MADDRAGDGQPRASALETILAALQEKDIDPASPVQILIRVQGSEERTLTLSLDNAFEMREILRTSTGSRE